MEISHRDFIISRKEMSVDNNLCSEVIAAIRAFTCATVAEAEAAAEAIIILIDDPPPAPEGICPDCNGEGEIYSYSSRDPASSIERCYSCDGTGNKK